MTLTRDEREKAFLKKAKLKYGTQYDYSKVHYENKQTKIVVICLQHGEFETTPNNFLSKKKKFGCPHCGREHAIKNRAKRRFNASKTEKATGCGTDQFNVRGGTKRYQHLLLDVFN